MAAEDQKWYYNPSTGEGNQGQESGWDDRMGPYDTEEEARNASRPPGRSNYFIFFFRALNADLMSLAASE